MPRGRALLVGIGRYLDPAFQHLTINNEVNNLAKALEDPMVGAFEVEVLLDATRDRIADSVAELFNSGSRGSVSLFYYIGHAFRDAKGVLCLTAADSRADRRNETVLDARYISEHMAHSESSSVVWLDCSFSGAFELPATGSGMAVLAACGASENVHTESDGRSAFSTEVINGLLNGAADQNGDGSIDVKDLYEYIRTRFAETGIEQSPVGHFRFDGPPPIVASSALRSSSDREQSASFGEPTVHAVGENLKQLRKFSIGGAVSALAVDTFGGSNILAVGGEDSKMRIIDLDTGTTLQEFTGSTGPIWGVALGQLDSQRRIAAGVGQESTLVVWDWHSGDRLYQLHGHGAPINAVSLSVFRHRPIAISASDDNTVRVWDLTSGNLMTTLTGHTHWVNTVAAAETSDGRSIVFTGSSDSTVKIWDLASGQALQSFTGHQGSVSSVAVAPLADGRLLGVSGSLDETVRVWDIDGERLLHTLPGNLGGVRTVGACISAGRVIIASGGNDGSVRVWEMDAYLLTLLGSPVRLQAHSGPVRAVQVVKYQNDNVLIVSGGEDGAVLVWTREPVGAGGPTAVRDQVEWVPDSPAQQDLLRRLPLAQALATRLQRVQSNEPGVSFLIHIDGAWGQGKSTLLNFMRHDLENDWLTIDFNAWRQARVGPAWWALLTSLRSQVKQHHGIFSRIWLRTQESWVRIRRAGAPFVFAVIVLLIMGVGIFLALGTGTTVKNAGDFAKATGAVVTVLGTVWAGTLVAGRFLMWDSPKGARLFEQSNENPMQDVAEHFAWLIRRTGRPVVFFIDDLDRCPGDYVVELLEVLQTLVRDPATGVTSKSVTGAHFVVAADGCWVRKSYEIAYEKFAESVAQPGRPLGYLFMDKLFQLRVPVPGVGIGQQEEFLEHLLLTDNASRGVPVSTTEEERSTRAKLRRSSSEAQILETLRRASPEVRERVAGTAVERLTEPEVEAATEHSLQKFGPLLPQNPRSIKRFLNIYSVLRAVRTLEGITVAADPLALWTIIEVRWPSLADYLRDNPDAIEAVGKPEADTRDIPSDMRNLLNTPEIVKILSFADKNQLSPNIIRRCCGLQFNDPD